MTSGIYKILNKSSNKFYIGSAINLEKRWINHLSDLRNSRHPNKHLQSSWNKHGELSFEFITLELVDVQDLISREQHYIDLLKPQYNICKVAGSTLGRKNSEETRRKLSIAHTGKKLEPRTEEHRKNLSRAMKKVPVEAIDPVTGLCLEFESIASTKSFGFKMSGVQKSIRLGFKHNGFYWRRL